MRKIFTALPVLAAWLLPAAAFATDAPSVCLAAYQIDHTDVIDDSTINFTMLDHTVWKNTLAFRCPGLKAETNGFTYEPTDPGSDTLCSNLVTIRLNTMHSVCELGAFTKVEAK